jgi:hypothetical protein
MGFVLEYRVFERDAREKGETHPSDKQEQKRVILRARAEDAQDTVSK